MTSTARVAKHRASGVRIGAVLTDPDVITAWRVLLASGGSQREVLARAVVMAASALPARSRGDADGRP